MKNLMINFLAENISDSARSEFMHAVRYENLSMVIQLLNDTISKLEKKIANENGTYSAEEVQAFNVQLTNAQTELAKAQKEHEALTDNYNRVLTLMTQKNEDHFGNSVDVVRTVLRVLGSWDNSKLVKYAIIPAFESPELYEALQAIHINSKAGENGNITMSNEVKEAYKKASDELERIIKVTFSLPFETPYTTKTRVKLTAEDKKLLNDCYIKGFSNKFEVDDEEETVKFKKRQINTLVKVTKNRQTGEKTYDYSGLATTISNIVIKHYFA